MKKHSTLIIYIEQLRGGHKESINLDLDPSFLDIHEKELSFDVPIHIEGEVYTADDHLVFHLTGSTQAKLPCAVCNKSVSLNIKIENLYETIPLQDLQSAIFDYSSLVREEFLLQLPLIAECNHGKCPERESLSPFLKKETTPKTHPTHFPFSDL